eukprot:scpid53760/ scgid8790/ 
MSPTSASSEQVVADECLRLTLVLVDLLPETLPASAGEDDAIDMHGTTRKCWTVLRKDVSGRALSRVEDICYASDSKSSVSGRTLAGVIRNTIDGCERDDCRCREADQLRRI